MNRLKIKEEFNNCKNKFLEINKEIESHIKKEIYSKYEYFEVFPFSFQRNSFKQGKIITDINQIKSTKNIFFYSFNDNDKIVKIKEGISIKNQFYYQFLKYEEETIKSYQFDNQNNLINTRHYYLNNNKKIERMVSQGKSGGRDELYIYSNGLLKEIQIKQYDHKDNEADPYTEKFEYDKNNKLNQIVKSFENGYSKIIYRNDTD